jgi:Raf kinase inhibitor-like YbhB/YbcL family protein
MKITSPAFADKIPVPVQYTCKGENVSPPLEFIDVPKEAKSLVVIVEDFDSPDKRVHWLVYNIPGDCTHFNEGKSSKDAMQGICSDGVPGYQGPCPKQFKGIHRFSFRLIALDSMLPDNPLADGAEIQKRMGAHILDSAELIGVAEGEQVSESVS